MKSIFDKYEINIKAAPLSTVLLLFSFAFIAVKNLDQKATKSYE